MRTAKRSLAAAACLAALTVLSSPALAGRGRHGWHGGEDGPRHGLMRAELIAQVAAELGVDEATLARIRDLIYEANKELVDLRADVQRARVELHHQLAGDAPEAGAVMSLVEQLGAKETLVHKNRVGLLLSVRELLTPEQRTKLRSILAIRQAEQGPDWGAPGYGRGVPGKGPGRQGGPGAGQGPCPGLGPCGY